jgi:hypothetical protein
MALSHDVISAKRQRKAAARAKQNKNLKTYKQEMLRLRNTKPEVYLAALKNSPRGGKKK